MGKNSRHFGSPDFTRLERLVLRGLQLEQALGGLYLKLRYRARADFGPGCKIDYRTLVIAGAGAVEFGEGVIIERGLHKVGFHLEPGSMVSVGRGSWIQTFDSSTVFSCKAGAKIEIGERCWFSGGIFGASKSIVVGDHTLIGWGCTILDSSLHRMDNFCEPVEPAPVKIGSHVWMPSNITVLPGVSIGDHCVIGTGSLIKDDIPDNCFAAGTPARAIKKLGARDQVE